MWNCPTLWETHSITTGTHTESIQATKVLTDGCHSTSRRAWPSSELTLGQLGGRGTLAPSGGAGEQVILSEGSYLADRQCQEIVWLFGQATLLGRIRCDHSHWVRNPRRDSFCSLFVTMCLGQTLANKLSEAQMSEHLILQLPLAPPQINSKKGNKE